MWYLMVTILAMAVGYAIGVMMREKRYYDLRHDYQCLMDWMYRQVVQNGKDAVLRAEARKVLTELANE